MRLEIAVTQEDIAVGIPDSSLFCPVARAIRLATGAGLVSVDVDEIVIRFRPDGGPPIYIDTPDEIVEFIDAFDSGEEVEPFGFNLDDGEGGEPTPPTWEPPAAPAPPAVLWWIWNGDWHVTVSEAVADAARKEGLKVVPYRPER